VYTLNYKSLYNAAPPAPRLGGSPGGIAPFMGGSYCPLGGGVARP